MWVLGKGKAWVQLWVQPRAQMWWALASKGKAKVNQSGYLKGEEMVHE